MTTFDVTKTSLRRSGPVGPLCWRSGRRSKVRETPPDREVAGSQRVVTGSADFHVGTSGTLMSRDQTWNSLIRETGELCMDVQRAGFYHQSTIEAYRLTGPYNGRPGTCRGEGPQVEVVSKGNDH